MSTNYGQQVYAQGSGTASTTLFDAVRLPRNPTTGDNSYPLGKFWVNTSSNAVWYLGSYTGSSTGNVANWANLSAGSILMGVLTINNVFPDGTGNFTFTSSDGTISITPIANGLNLKAAASPTIYQGNSGGNVTPNPIGNLLTINGNTSTGINVVGNSPLYTLTVNALTATTAQQGTLLLATNAQAIAGTDAANAITSAALAAKLGTQTAHSLAVFKGTSSALTALGAATNGQLPIGSTGADPVLSTLTAGTGISITNGAGSITIATSSSGTTTFAGDTGTATPSAGTITFNANSNCGASVLFTAASSTVTLKVSDGNFNTLIGSSSGNGTLSGANNTALGTSVLTTLTTGSSNTGIGTFALEHVTTGVQNTGIGNQALASITTGSYNVSLGLNAGSNYTSSESSNILIGNLGTLGESNVIRIGTQGSGSLQQNACYIAGIQGVSVSNTNLVTINTSTTQMGSTPMAAIGASMVLLSSQTVSGSSGVTFTSLITSKYNDYIVLFNNVTQSAGNNILIQTSTNNGSSYTSTGYQSGFNFHAWNGAGYSNANTTSGVLLSNSTAQIAGQVTFTDFSSGNTWLAFGQGTFSTGPIDIMGTGTDTTVNALKISPSAGTFSGTFTLYGIRTT